VDARAELLRVRDGLVDARDLDVRHPVRGRAHLGRLRGSVITPPSGPCSLTHMVYGSWPSLDGSPKGWVFQPITWV